MKIHDKLKRLTQFSKLTIISKAAGLDPSTLNYILERESKISTQTAINLARVIGVPVSWLIDDLQGFPIVVNPPTSRPNARTSSAA